MTERVKYPKTMHLPWSPGLMNDDRVVAHLEAFRGEEVIVTEKMDGENTTLYNDTLHARSIDGRYHPSRDWIKRFWAETVAYRLPELRRICGENMYAQHSIRYDNLETYFYGFGVWDNDMCLGWDDTLSCFEEWGITPVPILWRGEWNETMIRELSEDLDLERQEGLVVRVTRAFKAEEFPLVVAKWVRSDHIKTDEHWMHQAVTPNKLQESG